MSEFFVYAGALAGKCWWTERQGRVSSVFSYEDAYVADGRNWNVDPALTFAGGAQPTGGGLPRAFRDAAPDRWGRRLIEHRLRREWREQGRSPRMPNEVDWLFGVSDHMRQGSLRFSHTLGGRFEHPSSDVPKLVELPQLLRSSARFSLLEDAASIEHLLGAGSASLGGARPKASVQSGERLMMAKFPHRHDEWDVIAWEWAALMMAEEAGIRVPAHELVRVGSDNVLLTERFDRKGDERIGYISAMTLLGRDDGESADYIDIALGIRDVGRAAAADAEELFRRIAFSLCVNNTDDHLRNHGFLQDGSGWRLSPMFDVNPNPDLRMARATGVFGEYERCAALSALSSNADAFGLEQGHALRIMADVRLAVRSWERHARDAKIPKSERARFREVFESA